MPSENIKELHEAMRKYALAANIKESNYDEITRNLDKVSEDIKEHVKEELQKLFEKEFQQVKDIYENSNMTEEMWENYKHIFSGDVLPEQKKLTEARKKLKSKYREFLNEFRERYVQERKSRSKDSEGNN